MNIVFIESNLTGVPGILAAIQAGYHVYFLTADASFYLKNSVHAKEAFASKKCTVIEAAEVADIEGCLAICRRLHSKNRLSGVLTFSELHIVHAAAAAKSLGLLGMDPEAARNARFKHLTRTTLHSFGNMNQPRFKHVNRLKDLRAAVMDLGFPCVIKPSDGTASLSVVHISDDKQLEAYIAELETNANYGRGLLRCADLVVEEFIPGELVSVEACVHGGKVHNLGITDRKLSGFPYFIEMGGCYFFDCPERSRLFDLNEQILVQLGIDFGFVHTEFILSQEGPVLCEVNGRLAGGFIPTLMSVSTGVNPLLEAVRLAAGDTPLLPILQDQVAAGRWFGSPVAGTIDRIGFDNVKIRTGFVEASAYRQCGQATSALAKSNYDWLGHLIFMGNSRSQASERAEAALGEVELCLRLALAT